VTLQTAADGIRLLPAGRTTDVPWLGISDVPITLSQAATLTAADVTVSSAIGVKYGPVTISGSGTSYTITLAQPIEQADRVTITIASASIATYTRRLDVLPGDFNDDGAVNAQDIVGIRNEWLRLNGFVPTIFGDINGDGLVNAIDNNDARARIGTALPVLSGAGAAIVAGGAAAATVANGSPVVVRIGMTESAQASGQVARATVSRPPARPEIQLAARGKNRGVGFTSRPGTLWSGADGRMVF
jgi:hypothetical protein